MSYWKTIEDPTYDDDGIMVDEDHEWEDLEDLEIGPEVRDYDPFSTINS